MILAQQALRRGRVFKFIRTEVGYGSEAALWRALYEHGGVSPREWAEAAADMAA